METKTIVYHAPSARHVVVDHPSQIHAFVNELLGRPNDTSVEVIPKEFQVFPDVPYHAFQG